MTTVHRAQGRGLAAGWVLVGSCLAFGSAISTLVLNLAIATLLLPVWLPTVWRDRAHRVVLVGVAACCAYGLALTAFTDPLMVSNALALLNVKFLITACFCYGMWAWLLSFLSLRRVAFFHGLGAIANVLLHPIIYEENIWKYGLSWPLVVVFLALTIASRSVWIDATLLAIAAFSLALESRIHGIITFGTSVSYWFRIGAVVVERWKRAGSGRLGWRGRS